MNDFQRDFARALFDPDADCPLASQPGFQVYRNTVIAGWVDALQANFPTVCQFVGEDWFRAMAREYALSHPPSEPALVRYGAHLPAFLAGFEPAAGMPWLADLAQADLMHLGALFAADDDALAASRVATLSPQELAGARLRPHASARWAWFEAAPIATLWRRHCEAREAATDPDLSDVAWQPEGLLLVRSGACVLSRAVTRAAVAFLDACAGGATLAEAAARALDCDPDTDLSQLMHRSLQDGVFGELDFALSNPIGAVSPVSTQEISS